MPRKTVKLVSIGAGSFFCRGTIADLIGSPEAKDLSLELALVDTDQPSLERMYRYAVLVKEHYGSDIALSMTTDRREALPGADYVITSVAIHRYPLWEQDFRLPLAYGFRHCLGENGGPGAAFHALRNYELMVPICRDMEKLCPEALLLNYTNPESRIIRAVTDLTKIKSVGLCHGVFGSMDGAAHILGKKTEELDFISGGLNHFFWVTKVADKKTGRDLYPELRKRVLEGSAGWAAPPLVKKMVEVFGCYTYPSDDHIGEYVSFATEFTGLKWHYGREVKPVARGEEAPEEHWLDPYVSGKKPLDEKALSRSGELAVPIALAIEQNRPYHADAVNVPNTEGYVAELPRDAVVEVPATIDGKGVHPQKIGPIPEGLAAFCRTQCSIQKLLVQAYRERSKNLLLQTLLLDPVVDSVGNAERLMEDMLKLQKDYLPEFS
ncbi:MAG: alpha-glucosidase/alpha-galactosidase [Armatimonadota bacterium]